MKTRSLNLEYLPAATIAALSSLLLAQSSPVQAVTLVTNRAAVQANDQIDWSSLGPAQPFNFLPNTFSATSERGLGLTVEIPPSPISGITPPFVFQTLPPPGIPTNFAPGDFLLFTGFIPGPPPAVGNSNPLSINFATPVFGAGAQIAVDDTPEFTAFISAFDSANTLLGSFSAMGTSSLALDNSAVFLGIRSETPNISRLVFSSSAQNRAFAINNLSIRSAAVPEPSTIFALGLVAVGVFVIKKRSHQPQGNQFRG